MIDDREVYAGMDTISVATGHDGLPRLTRQEAEFAATLAATSDKGLAARRAGITLRKASQWAKRDDILAHVDNILSRHKEFLAQGAVYTLADAHADLEMGKRMAATATEFFRGVELQMRLHGLGEKRQSDVTVNINNVTSRGQLESLDDAAILEMAGISLDDLLPEAIDGEIVTDGE
jgi:hypothetical protein